MHTHITRAHLKGYRNIQDTEATFREGLNIIIGPNGCGKTNFLWLLVNRMSDDAKSIHLETVLEWYLEKEKKILIEKVNYSKNIKDKYLERNIFINNDFYTNSKQTEIHWDTVGNILLLDFNIPSEIKSFSIPFTLDMYIDETLHTGKYLPIISDLMISKKTKINFSKDITYFNFDEKIIKQLSEYSPIKNIKVKYPLSNDDIKTDEHGGVVIPNFLYEFQIEDGRYYTWNELSDGTRRIVWLILNILTTNRDVILIEEPELGIHPHQLFLLMQFIKEQSEHKQIIITTHSPEVLNVIESDELDRIKIARYDAERKTTVIENIPEKRQKLIQKYLSDTGQLSDYWVHVNLEGTHKWTK